MLTSQTLRVRPEKTFSIALRQAAPPRRIYHCGLPASLPETGVRRGRQYEFAECASDAWLQLALEGRDSPPSRRVLDSRGFPCPLADSARVLGAHSDEWLTLDTHFGALFLGRRCGRSCLRAARSSWGLIPVFLV